jgi:aspartyl-tRNA synthetase
MAMHHPFTSPKPEDIPLLDTDMGAVRANAYDMVINGVEVGGGSIRIYDSALQNKMFELLGFTPERTQQQFGWLLDAFKYGAPPHGGLAYGLDRWVSLFAGLDSIRDCIAFPKNNSGRDTMKTRKQLCELRLEVASQLGLRDKNKFSCLWVVDFPLFEYSEEEGRYMAMHHPFTSPKPEDIPLLDTDMGAVRANAYDMVINGVEVGGGSIRIYDSALQNKMFELLGFTPERAQQQFGWLLDAFKYGAPPHGGLAYGLDRWVSLFAGLDSIRDCIAFPKNNSGRDTMIEAPSVLEDAQLDELNIKIVLK